MRFFEIHGFSNIHVFFIIIGKGSWEESNANLTQEPLLLQEVKG